MKRLFDAAVSFLALIVLSPVMLVIWLLVKLTSKGPGIFAQTRVGRHNKDFTLYKFRTMYINAHTGTQITIGNRDPRITPVGYFLRKYKLDELPQLVNVLTGDMSFVGPRPEVRKYVDMYSSVQLQVLSVRPGITDYASLLFINENELLGQSQNPEHEYVHTIMPQKLELNLKYIQTQSFWGDMRLIFKTVLRIMGV
jgi:lipopolysaccharide/colanic/teichoic acid biosynthesis glycosyltransferase